MKKSVVIGGIIVVIALAGGGILVAKNSDKETSDDTKTTSTNRHKTMSSSAQNNNATHGATSANTSSVTIQSFAFNPNAITVKKGTTVTWTNKDSAAHTVTENDGQTGPKSDTLATGKTYSFTYDTAGTFKYHCSIHPEMTGTVTVTE